MVGQGGGYRCHLDWDQRYLSLMSTDIPGYYQRMASFSQRFSQELRAATSDSAHAVTGRRFLLHIRHIQVSEPVNQQPNTSISGSVDRSLLDKSYLCTHTAGS